MIKEIKNGRLTNGDCLKELKHYPSDCIDLIITDPPYGLSYYCLDWDKKVPGLAVWQECLRVLKPGAFIFVMSAVRQDVLSRMIVNLTDAGFNTQFTSLYWTYTSGFPKASNITNAINRKSGGNAKLSTGLIGSYAGFQPRPAVEAILVAMKPLTENCYVDQAIANKKGITFLDDAKIPFIDKQGQLQKRFMSNLVISDNALDPLLNGIECTDNTGNSYRFSLDAWAMHVLPYLMVSKPSQLEKDLGLDELPDDKIVCRDPGQRSFNVPMKHRPSDRKNIHPTVKPLKLMAYLTVLGSRPGDIVLDPYCGSGTSCVAAKLLGRKFVGMEIDKPYYEIAKTRLTNISRIEKPPEESAANVSRLSEVESITLRYHDKSVLDMSAIPSLIDEALGNPVAGVKNHGNVEISTVLRPESPEVSVYQKMIADTPKGNRTKRNPKIISVSRRTDIPAFYSDWFFNRVKEGVALVKTNIDSDKIEKVFLEPEDVRCFVFWTKNPGPMLDRLDELDRYRYYFQFTLTPYGPDIENNLPPKDELIETFIRLSKQIGKEKVIWRYDPIILTDTIDIEYHKQRFEAMVKRLHLHTEKCVISFVEAGKIPKEVREAMKLKIIDDDMKWELASWIQFIAESYGLKVETCAQKIDFSEIGIRPARCVDPRLIGYITGFPVKIAKDTKQRKKCGCVPSTDIGTNNTCTHGCLYCYATKAAAQARLNYQQHDCESPAMTMEMEVNGNKEKDNVQDWADKGINISKGCSNNCRYCYAREESVRRHGNVYENWTNEQLNQKIIKKGWRRSSKKLMFPTTHDITPGTYDACESVLKKLLKAGNEVLVVSKPRFDLIEKLCDALEAYKAQVMFRFTISARNNEILSFWEPNAPCYEDRVDALIIAFAKGFMTSVSIEPMLDPADIKGLVEDLRPYTSDSMWIGPVKMIRKRTRIDSEEIELEVKKIEAGQTPEKLLEVYNLYKDDPLIKWKGHFRKLLRKIGVEVPEQNDNWRDKI